MRTIATYFLYFVISSASLSGHATGIPVVDVAHMTQTILIYGEHVKQLAELMEQVKTAQKQLEEAKKAYAAVTGARGMAALADTAAVRQALPPGFVATADSIRSMGSAGASQDAKKIYESIKRFGCDEKFPANLEARRRCEVNAYMTPTTISLLQESIGRAQGRAEKLAFMVGSIDSTDVKAAADLQNRIAIESAMLANEKILMDMALHNQKAQQDLLVEQRRELGIRRLVGKVSPQSAGTSN